ncbi:hypothetical protein ACHAW5_008994 [Stephanodiscus triporus]|uniref:Uncharacterized protein n=1 Tax=Stephanodiscus triporus TaxID=2934178 RepID=A0ABD3PJI1_9STRA
MASSSSELEDVLERDPSSFKPELPSELELLRAGDVDASAGRARRGMMRDNDDNDEDDDDWDIIVGAHRRQSSPSPAVASSPPPADQYAS